jgi:putative spermidine/putrescine transport system ATP-binding protein
MTVGQNVAYGLRVKGIDKPTATQKALQMLKMVELENMFSRHPAQLSGGQRQRVALVRALINEPRVLLLDEPLGALDLKMRKQMQVELKALQRQLGITFIYVTHDHDEALSMSDRLAVFRHGKIEQIGTPKAIYETPASRFVADFVGNANVIDDSLSLELTGVPKACAIRPEKIFFADDDQAADDNVVTTWGTITDCHYHGANTHVTVSVGNDRQLVVIRQNGDQIMKDRSRAAQRQRIAWHRKDIHYFEE